MDIPVDPARGVLGPTDQVLRIGQVAKLLRRHAWLIVACALVGAVLALAYAWSLPRYYTASGSVAVEGERFAIPELQGALRSDAAPDPMPWVRTEVQAVTARDLVQGVIAQLKLAQDPEFNAALRPPTLVQQAKAAIQSLLPAPRGPTVPVSPDEAVLLAANRALVVSQDNRDLVLGISFTARDPALAAGFVNTLVKDYVASRAARRATANKGANAALVQRIDQVRDDLNGIQARMQDLRSKAGLVELRTAGSVGQQQLQDLATAAANATLQRAQLEANWERATALAKQGSSDALASVLDSPTVAHLREQESQASSRVADLSSHYGPNYPGVRSAQADLQATQRQIAGETSRIVASLDAQVRVARAHEADVQQQLAQARQAGVQMQNVQAQLDQLQEEETSRRSLYTTLLERAQQTAAEPSRDETPDVRVLSTAAIPSLPSGPNMKLAGGFGGLSGAILGCLLALARIRSADGFPNAGEFTGATGLSVLATLPAKAVRGAARGGRGGLAGRVGADAAGPEAEAMRLLRGRLRSVSRSGGVRSVVFTAAAGSASGFAAAFARVAAADGEHVLLIEGNLRAPELGRVLGAPAGHLVPVLEGQEDWRDVLVPDQGAPLDLLLGGASPPDAHALLTSTWFQNLLIEARDEYGLIVLDAPAAGEADTLALARRTDVTVIVVDGARAKRLATVDAAGPLGNAARSPVAAVLIGP